MRLFLASWTRMNLRGHDGTNKVYWRLSAHRAASARRVSGVDIDLPPL